MEAWDETTVRVLPWRSLMNANTGVRERGLPAAENMLRKRHCAWPETQLLIDSILGGGAEC